MTKLLSSFSHDESGTTSIEYGVIAIFVSVLTLVAIYAFDDRMTEIAELVGAAF